MRRFREDRPADICFARGTFNSHPVVMATMNEFLKHLDDPAVKNGYRGLDDRWNERAGNLNVALKGRGLPVRVANMTSIWTILYLEPSRYNWMLQYYLRERGISLSWIGTGRLVFSHNLEEKDFVAIVHRIDSAAEAMREDGFWWRSAAATNQSIKRHVLRELVSAAFRRRARRPSAGESSVLRE
jgi:glutamate-1-semialdehyde 2,1-aminomutase